MGQIFISNVYQISPNGVNLFTGHPVLGIGIGIDIWLNPGISREVSELCFMKQDLFQFQ